MCIPKILDYFEDSNGRLETEKADLFQFGTSPFGIPRCGNNPFAIRNMAQTQMKTGEKSACFYLRDLTRQRLAKRYV